MTFELKSAAKAFGGQLRFLKHHSTACNAEMSLALFLPDQIQKGPVPVLFWLSGLTCTEENFMIKAGAQRYAAEHGIAIVAPDTSPRGLDLPGEHDHWDFGSGAGFYVNSTQEPWSHHYNMYEYVTAELPRRLEKEFCGALDLQRRGISGHSMGGHGALVIGLRNADRFRSISALAPISNPTQCPWGQKAFSNYLGPDQDAWKAYDACELLRQTPATQPILVDQGDADNFLEEQLHPYALKDALKAGGYDFQFRMQPGYDHSFYFVATVIGDHIAFHAKHLKD